MKKATSFSFTILAILGITFFACKLKVEEADLYDKPGVNVTNNQVTIIIPKISNDTKYINVYRRDKQNDEVINIGILYHPLALENDNKNYCYIDTLVKIDHSYEYRVRYNVNDGYYLSEWSDTIYIDSTYKAYPEEQNLSYKANGAYFIYEKTDFTLLISGNILLPDFPEFRSEYYKPMLIVSTDESTQTFEISSVANGTSIALRGLLPAKFFDKEITIQGIVAQKTVFDDPDKVETERLIKSVTWTEPEKLDIVGAGSSKTVIIPSQSGAEGLDYSRKVR